MKPSGGPLSLVISFPQVNVASVVKWWLMRFSTFVCSELYSESPPGYPFTTTPLPKLPLLNCGYGSSVSHCGTVGDPAYGFVSGNIGSHTLGTEQLESLLKQRLFPYDAIVSSGSMFRSTAPSGR